MQTENVCISIKPNPSTQDKNSQNTKRASGTLNIPREDEGDREGILHTHPIP